MASRQLRGARYVEGLKDPDLARIITDVLPFMDFEEATRFYDEAVVRRMAHADLALLGCNDRYFLLTVLMHRKDAVHPWLYDRCREVEARPDGFLDLWARFHYKSTIITFAGCIQEVLCNPELRIGIFSNTVGISRKFLGQIRQELTANTLLQGIYPDVLYMNPKKDAPSWSLDGGLVVKRKGNPKESSLEAHGLIDAMPTGRHFPLLVFDDVITQKNVNNPDQIKKATEAVEMADNLGEPEGTRRWYIGTRYHFGDSYGHLLEHSIVSPRVHPATHDGTLNGNPVFLSKESWEERKRNQRSTIAAQMLQNPLAGQENTFKAEWLAPYYVRPAVMNVYIMVDPSLGIHKTSDRTAMAVVGVDANSNKFLLDGFCHRMSLTDRWDNLRMLYKLWSNMIGVQLIAVGYERYGQQTDAEYFAERMREPTEDIVFDITELNWTNNRQGESKAHRVGRLEPDFRNNSFFVPGKVWHPGVALANTPERISDIEAKIAAGKIAKPDATTALWSIDEKGQKIIYRSYLARHPEEREVIRNNELHRLIHPLRRIDKDRNIYDLTRVLFEEFLFFPFSPRDDLVDAISRIYDMKPQKADVREVVERRSYSDD